MVVRLNSSFERGLQHCETNKWHLTFLSATCKIICHFTNYKFWVVTLAVSKIVGEGS